MHAGSWHAGHSLTLPAETFVMGKRLSTLALTKAKMVCLCNFENLRDVTLLIHFGKMC